LTPSAGMRLTTVRDSKTAFKVGVIGHRQHGWHHGPRSMRPVAAMANWSVLRTSTSVSGQLAVESSSSCAALSDFEALLPHLFEAVVIGLFDPVCTIGSAWPACGPALHVMIGSPIASQPGGATSF